MNIAAITQNATSASLPASSSAGQTLEEFLVLNDAAAVRARDLRRHHAIQTRIEKCLESHVLLAVAFSDSGVVDATCHELGITRESIVAGLAERGVEVPSQPPPSSPPAAPMDGLSFPVADLPAVLEALVREYPPGSAVRWGMNRIDDRGIIVTDSSEAIGLVRSTVADPNTLAPLTP